MTPYHRSDVSGWRVSVRSSRGSVDIAMVEPTVVERRPVLDVVHIPYRPVLVTRAPARLARSRTTAIVTTANW